MAFPSPQQIRKPRFRALRTIVALILREMTSTFGRSPGGYLWMILEPTAAIALLSFVFSLLLRHPSMGTNFPYFYAPAMLAYQFFLSISGQIAKSLNYSRALLSYSAVTFMDALLARFLLNALTQLLVLTIVMTGIVLIYDLHPILDWPSLFLAMAMLFALTIAVGSMNCFLFSSFPLWERFWNILTRPLFLLSGIIFMPEDVAPRFRDLLMLNPLIHITSQMRKGFFVTYDAVYVRPLYVFTISLVLGIFGMLFLIKNHKDIVLK